MPAHSLQTLLIHGDSPEPIEGSVVAPIFQSATYVFHGDREEESMRYLRMSNSPTQEAVARKLALAEQAEAALVTASGMAAISATLFSVLQAGDRLLAQETLYGGTAGLFAELPHHGIAVDRFDPGHPESLDELVGPTTRAIYTEALSNPLVQVPPHEAIVAFARRRGLVSMIDATFATPYNFRPVPFGYDLVLHSATKYLNGHSDLVAGVVAGSREQIERIAARAEHLGGSLDPHACFLLDRGLKTLTLRMEHHNRSALRLASFLEGLAAVERVFYPGLPSHPDHERARSLLRGSGGVLAFELASGEAARRCLDHLRLATVAPSLGGVETLVSRPAVTSHRHVEPAERRRLGIADGLIRVAVGLEATDDLIADFETAIAASSA